MITLLFMIFVISRFKVIYVGDSSRYIFFLRKKMHSLMVLDGVLLHAFPSSSTNLLIFEMLLADILHANDAILLKPRQGSAYLRRNMDQ